MTEHPSPVRLIATDDPSQPPRSPELEALYRTFEAELLVPLWTEISGLMPATPHSDAVPHLWEWDKLLRTATRAGELVPVGRGGERRAIALANPGLGGAPYATPTLWAAIQYLNPRESAPVHRHSQHAFRFVIEGEGVATVVNGDPIPMRRGDFLPQPGGNWHSHDNQSDEPMAWIDGLDIPLQRYLNTTFFEPGCPDDNGGEQLSAPSSGMSESERLWSHPGLRPLSRLAPHPATPLLAYRWEHTDAALLQQLELEADGVAATVGPGHAAVRYTNPANGQDALPTMRAEVHRPAPGARTAAGREVGSSVFQVFAGSGQVTISGQKWELSRGDLFVVPSWSEVSVTSKVGIDLFRFSDSPVIEQLGLNRSPLWCS